MKLRWYQEELVKTMGEEPYGALFLAPGLGKTSIVLHALQEAKDRGEKIAAFIFGPIRVIETVWKQESRKWGLDLTFSIIRGSPAERKAKLNANVDVYLVNFELIPWLFEQPETLKIVNYGGAKRYLFIDESTMMKSPKTKRWKKMKPHVGKFHRRWILTGTPIPNTYMDLWAQIGLLDRGKRLESAFSRFTSKYFEQDYTGFNWLLKEGSAAQINDKIKDISHRVQLKEALVDEPIETPVEIALSPKELAKYSEMERESIADFYRDMDEEEGEEIPAFSAAALHGKLSQLANGFIYNLEGEAIEFHARKMEVLSEIYEELNGKNMLVVYKFRHEIDQMKAMFKGDFKVLNEGKAEDMVKDWNDRKIRILGLHPRSGGHGLNLQYGGSHMVMTTPMYNPEHYEQLVRRLARPGQEEAVVVQVLKALGTVDFSIDNKLGERTSTMVSFLEYVTSKKV